MNKRFFAAGSLFGLLSVVFGAFGAHALKSLLSTDALAVFETAVRYQFYHALVLLITGLAYEKLNSKWAHWSGNLFILGIVLFSGSLYTLTFLKIGQPSASLNLAGIITPFGGLSLIAGWLFLFLAASKGNGQAR